MTTKQLATYVTRSTKKSGVPVKVSDKSVLAKLARILRLAQH